MKVHVGGTVGVCGGNERRHTSGDDGIIGDELRTEGSELDFGSEPLNGVDGREDMSSGLAFDERLDGEFDPQHETSVGRVIGPRAPERDHSRHRIGTITSSPADSWEHERKAVRKKSFDSPSLVEFVVGNPPGFGNLAIGEDEWTAMDHLEAASMERDRIVVERK